MIDSLAARAATAIKRANPEQTSSVEVLRYALIIYINTTLIVVESLLIGWLSGKLKETLLCLVAVNVLRYFSGGRHVRTTWGCNLVSVAIFTIVPHVPLYHSSLTMIANLASVLLVLLFAPNIDSETSVEKAAHPRLKLISFCIVAVNFAAGSWLLALSFLIQSLTLLPAKGGGHDESGDS